MNTMKFTLSDAVPLFSSSARLCSRPSSGICKQPVATSHQHSLATSFWKIFHRSLQIPTCCSRLLPGIPGFLPHRTLLTQFSEAISRTHTHLEFRKFARGSTAKKTLHPENSLFFASLRSNLRQRIPERSSCKVLVQHLLVGRSTPRYSSS